MKVNAPGAYTAATEAAKGVAEAYRKANDQHSPSKVFEKIGGNGIEGLIVGYKGKEQPLRSQISKIASIASGLSLSSSAMSLGSAATSQMSGLSSTQNISTSTTEASTVVSLAGANFTVRSDADIKAIVKGIAREIADQKKGG